MRNCELAEWECALLNGPGWGHSHTPPTRKRTSISVFTLDGRSETFDDVQVETVTVRVVGTIGGFKVLSFKTLDFRTVNVLDVSYWTVDEK